MKPKITCTLVVVMMTCLLAFSVVRQVWAQEDPYEPTGGILSPISPVMTFLVPVLAIVGILGALVVFGWFALRLHPPPK